MPKHPAATSPCIQTDLFADTALSALPDVVMAEGAMLLRRFATAQAPALLHAVETVIAQAPLRHMVTPGGYRMSVAMTNCGKTGWVTDRTGYRYVALDPVSGRVWPPLPDVLLDMAQRAAVYTGFDSFVPDACLINCYTPGTRLSLHQDANERNTKAPVVSISLGLPAMFLFGGNARTDKTQRHRLEHGDVAVWGGPARLAFHGIAPLADGMHPLLGRKRLNITFRTAL